MHLHFVQQHEIQKTLTDQKRTVREIMNETKTNSIEIPLKDESYVAADRFIKQWMAQKRISDKSVYETMLLFEALFNDMIEQGFGEDTILTIKTQKHFGEYTINLGFEGDSYIPIMKKDNQIISPELKIVQAYSDKVGYRYRLGYNHISIVVKRNYNSSLIYCFIAIAFAMIVSTPLIAFISPDDLASLDDTYIQPLIQQFANAMLMIGAPVTFFSLVKNLSDIYILSEKSSSARKLQVKTIVTSFISVILALVTAPLIADILYTHQGYFGSLSMFTGGMNASEFISSLVPSNIFEPFETFMPFPIIILSLLLTYALCSIGEHFGAVHRFINICLDLFSKMLTVVMFTLPFFCFFATVSMLMIDGIANLIIVLEHLLIVALSLVVIAAFYLIRLMIGRVKINSFVRRLPALMWENIKISSAIDAIPFNIRYCSRKYGYNRNRLSEKLPILAHTNLDGNCFLIMLISMSFIFLLGIEVSWLQIVGIAFLILFLSVGAPNQPGSIMIGMLIITLYLQTYELIQIAIFAEVFFGWLQNLINVIGDIVTVAIEEQKYITPSSHN